MAVAPTPREIYGELFDAVQRQRVFTDSKTFVDAVPRHTPAEVIERFSEERDHPAFDLRSFVTRHFDLPDPTVGPATPGHEDDVIARIDALWPPLTRAADERRPHASLIALPHRYVVPGGRFRELYYWDSYFTMLGLASAGHTSLVEAMVDNFASLIDRVGFIPNGNRTYYCTRSQPPFFVLMVDLLASLTEGSRVVDRYAPQLEREYLFWMAGASRLTGDQPADGRVVAVGDALLNRYWDDAAEPRQESYAEDVALAASGTRDPAHLFRDLRAACESGWDFSSRWFGDAPALHTIRTTEILPVDLNCLLHRLETVLAGVKQRSGDADAARRYHARAAARAHAIQTQFFDEETGYFCDLDLREHRGTGTRSLAGAVPLFLGLATAQQATRVASRLEREFLRPGGWVTTTAHTGQQWDAPNGWAPLQWMVFEGLRRYGFLTLAREGARRWVATVTDVYRATGHFMEKYNVEDPERAAGGGEYEVQVGFGWTNGVLRCLIAALPG